MSGNKEKSFPPPVPKRKPQGFKPKSGEVPGIQRLYGSNHSSEAPPTIDQTTVKSPLSGLLNPLHGGRPQQSNLASTPPSYPIAQVLTTILAANRGSNIEPGTSHNDGHEESTTIGPLQTPAPTDLQANKLSSYFLSSSPEGLTQMQISRRFQIS